MEHPIFSLSTKPDHRIRRYDHGNVFVEVKPGADGLATIHDRDVLIYCISQLMAALNRGEKVPQVLRFKAYDLLKATNRPTGGVGYARLKAALNRLQSTQIETNITTGGVEQIDIFSLIDHVRIVRETREGRMLDLEIKLSDWVFNAIQSKEALTLHRDYFRLRKPLERRIYEIARKQCGYQPKSSINLDTLQRKCGSNSSPREFKRLVTNIVKDDERHNHIPDYALRLEGEKLWFINRNTMPQIETPKRPQETEFHLSADTYDEAREVAPGWDIYYLEREWRDWIREPPRNPDAAFLGFCRKWYEKRGAPR